MWMRHCLDLNPTAQPGAGVKGVKFHSPLLIRGPIFGLRAKRWNLKPSEYGDVGEKGAHKTDQGPLKEAAWGPESRPGSSSNEQGASDADRDPKACQGAPEAGQGVLIQLGGPWVRYLPIRAPMAGAPWSRSRGVPAKNKGPLKQAGALNGGKGSWTFLGNRSGAPSSNSGSHEAGQGSLKQFSWPWSRSGALIHRAPEASRGDFW